MAQVFVDSVIVANMRKQYSNWKQGFEELFPFYPGKDNKLAYKAFLELVYMNLKNHKNRQLDDPASEFAWFYQFVKMAKRHAHKAMIFSLWLYLCIERPWQKAEFLLGWRMHRSSKVQHIVAGILDDLGRKYDVTITETQLDKGFSLYEKDNLVRMCIAAYASLGPGIVERPQQIFLVGKFRQILKSGSVITKREIQKKLRISADQINALISEEKKRGTIQTIEKPCNSLWVIWKDPRGSQVHK